jgi:FkbM family methyltransferase
MRTTIPTYNGARLAVDPTALDFFVAVTLRQGAWDRQVSDACIALLQPGQVFYDVGANAGFVAITVGYQFADRVRVCAFEPQPSLARHAALSAALNGLQNISVYEVMLGREAGEALLYVPRHAIHASAVPHEAGAVPLRRPVRSLDELIQSGELPPPDVVKMDVEGAELDVFRGAESALKQYRPAVLFECDSNLIRFGYTAAELLAFLGHCAPYKFYRLLESGKLDPVTADDLARVEHTDVLAVPPGRSVS